MDIRNFASKDRKSKFSFAQISIEIRYVTGDKLFINSEFKIAINHGIEAIGKEAYNHKIEILTIKKCM